MNSEISPERQVMSAAQQFGIGSVLFRNAIGRKLGLTITDSECLSLLSIKGISTPTELARYTGLTTGSITALLDRLEKMQFITRTPNPDDRRGVLIEISHHYRQLAGPMVADIQKAHRELLATYSEAELTTIADFLTRFTENVKEQAQKIEKGS